MIDEKVVSLPVKPKKRSRAPLTIAYGYGGCQHPRVEVCEKNAEVTCQDCGAKLNPIWVLMRIAQDDRILVDRWASMKAEIATMGKRTRTKCRHCGQFTPVHSNANAYEIGEKAGRLREEKS